MEVRGDAGQRLLTASRLMKQGQYEAALNSALEALELCSKSGDKIGEAQAWQGIMAARLALGNFDGALKAAEASLVTCINNGDEDGRALTLHGIAKAHAGKGDAQKSLKAGSMALDLFRKSKNRKFEQAVLELVVSAMLAQGRIEDALRQATDGVASLQKAGERKVAALAMKSVMHVHIANGDGQNAVAVAEQAAATFLELGEQSLHAGMLLELARFQFAVGDYSASKDFAEKAIPYYKELSDTQGHSTAMEIFGAAEDAQESQNKGAPSEADREALMTRVLEAMQMNRGEDLRKACEEAYAVGITSKQLLNYVRPLVFDGSDPDGNTDVMNFWIDHQPPYLEFGDGKFADGTFFDRADMYFTMRLFGSMGYGPGFRLIRTAARTGHFPQDGANVRGLSVLRLKDDYDMWEEKVIMGHAGVLDCALQTGSVNYYPSEHSSLRKSE